MKSINKLAVAAVLALTGSNMASAATAIYHVSGSTAYRAAVVSAEVALCGGNSALATYYGKTSANPAPNLNNSSQSVIQNAGNTIRFENNFSGSLQGTECVLDGIAGKTAGYTSFPDPQVGDADYPTANVTAATVVAGTAGTPVTGGNNQTNSGGMLGTHTVTAGADIAFSDVGLTTVRQILSGTGSSYNTPVNPSLNEQVGIVPFVFVINATTDIPVSKITGLSMDPQKFTYTWQSQGSATLSFYTGNNADESITVYPLGRDVDSGTRGTALAETGYPLTGGNGIINNPVYQYYPYDSTGTLVSSSNTSINSLALVPASSKAGAVMPTGDGGYNSGGQLSYAMSNDFTSNLSATAIVTYLGVADADNALYVFSGTHVQNPQLMAYNGTFFYPGSTLPNGVTQAQNLANVYEGKYTFWSYENVFTNSTGSSIVGSFSAGSTNPPSGTLAYELYTQQYDSLASNGLSYNAMEVGRSGDGANVQ